MIALLLLLVPVARGAEASGINRACLQPGPPAAACLPNGDIDFESTDKTHRALSRAYAYLVWNDFLALNYPAKQTSDGRYLPQPSEQYGLDRNAGAYRTVWESYIDARDLFIAPLPRFGDATAIPNICKGGDHNSLVLDAYVQANRMGPVADTDGNYVRFNMMFNRSMYDYVKSHRLNTAAGQEAITAPLQWPRGAYTEKPALDRAGSIMLKAAWKVLGSQDQHDNYHRIHAYVYNEKGGPHGQIPGVEESCKLATLGLIGLHIVHRSNSAPQWVWATFEHRDNAPWMADSDNRRRPVNRRYSLFNTALCGGVIGTPDCPFNRIPAHPWNPGVDPLHGDAAPSQIVRLAAPGREALAVNKAVRDALLTAFGSTVWQHYFLVDVQFPTVTRPRGNGPHQINPAYPLGSPSPTFLTNTAMESFIQGFTPGDITSNGDRIPAADVMQTVKMNEDDKVDPWDAAGPYTRSGGANRNTSSCIGCHADGAMVTGIDAGFVFSVERAK